MSIKVIAFLAFACLQAGSLNGALLRSGNDCDAYKSKCPAVDGADPVYIPLPDCTKFCECSNGTPELFDCPSGLHFNPTLNVCDWPDAAGCTGGSGGSASSTKAPATTTRAPLSSTGAPVTTKAPTKAPTTQASSRTCDLPAGSCPAVDGTWPVYIPLKDCTQFCECSNGVPYLFDCPAGLHFNPTLNVCDWPNQAGCTGGSGGSSSNAPTATPTAAAPTSCATAVTTPTRAPTKAPTSEAPSRTCDLPAGSCPAVDGTWPVYIPLKDCTQFCECSNGVPYLFDCPAGLHFNPTLNVCDWPSQAGCTGGSGTTPTTKAPTAAPTTQPPTKAPTTQPPTKAPVTSAPTKAPTSAAPVGTCDLPTNTCPAVDGPDAVYIPAKDCTQFCECSNGVPYLFDCPAGLHFNPTLNVCDWPNVAGCTGGSGTTPTTKAPTPAPTTKAPTPAPTKAPTTNAPTKAPTTAASSGTCDDLPSGSCPAVDGTWPVYIPLKDCTKFCECSNGTPYLFDCPAGLHFNPTLNVCDYPDVAGCATA